ncbi:sigma-70 family RNA polymerase sigma factor [Arthrobacter sp. 24S4-2]|uniref:RNA polymerase sigma factor n=1 Tax=Arthrobacter sp. 24S4-2 TaxID=2575374 RepID=UPI0010C7B9B6|nr:sigma-70 family RNA polymerase sigma factor [Arthrobacter sp. 24S4-2]QCO96765.1 sigma-70 family RNA polymerase sigma factor [Arthrobacter sp. 24S4-2]
MTMLHLEHWDAGVAFAYSLTRDHNDAEELAAHAFLKVLSAMRSGKGPTGPFRPYFFRAIRTSTADHWRRRSYEYATEHVPETSAEDGGYAHVDGMRERAMASRAFAALPRRWQQVLWHVDVVGLRPRQLAPILEIEANAVSALVRRARRGLREAYLVEYVGSAAGERCREYLPLLARMVMDTASRRDILKVNLHRHVCSDCTAAAQGLREVHSRMRAAGTPLVFGAVISMHMAGHLDTGISVQGFLHASGVADVVERMSTLTDVKKAILGAAVPVLHGLARTLGLR